MKRVLSVLTMALVLAAMMVIMAMAAFADTPACREAQKNPNWDCQGNKLENPGGHSFGKISNR